MANLIDPNNERKKTFNPNVDNSKKTANASAEGKLVWYLLFLLIIPLIMHVVMKNQLMRDQMNINEAASGIDVQLKKRRDTLVKLVETTKSYIKYEKSVLTDLTKLRSSTFKNGANSSKLDAVSARIRAVAEAYPDLKANSLAIKTMEESTYIEREIAATRRLYNSNVKSFNQKLFTWPTNVIASEQGFETISSYQASEEDRKDVDVKF